MRAQNGWSSAICNLEREHGFEPLRIEGTIPEEIVGTFYRNGPGRVDVGGERYRHWFDSDGALTAVRFRGGKAEGASRIYHTHAFERQVRAGRRLFGGYNTPFARRFREIVLGDTRNPASTSVLAWNDRLYALCEAARPLEVDASSLHCRNESDLGGVVRDAFSAHPHFVPSRRAWYNIGIRFGRHTTVTVYELSLSGRARRVSVLRIEGGVLLHDFAVTEHHIVIPVPPLRINPLRMLLRGVGLMDAIDWQPERGTEIIVVPIDDPSQPVRFRVDPLHLEHVVTAWEDGGEIVFDATIYPTFAARNQFLQEIIDGRIAGPLDCKLVRVAVDPRRARARFTDLLPQACEFPRVSPHAEAARYRYAYFAGFSRPDTFFDTLLKVDSESGSVERLTLDGFPSEAVFVPRADAKSEDDGWLLTMVFTPRTGTSHVAVLDARAMSDGPIARAHLDQVIPLGFHGQWVASPSRT